MSNKIVFDIPIGGVKEDDIILIELTEDCDMEAANEICNIFKKIYPKADINCLHPSLVRSVRFFHKPKQDL